MYSADTLLVQHTSAAHCVTAEGFFLLSHNEANMNKGFLK